MRQPRKRRTQVGVPRRFGIATLMILTAAFAVLFSVLKMLGVPPVVFAAISIFVAVVATCQVLLFRGKNPRLASILAGTVMGVLIWGLVVAWGILYRHTGPMPRTLAIVSGVMSVLFGAMFGYVAGWFVAAVFLVWKEPDNAPPETSEDEERNQSRGNEAAAGDIETSRSAGILPAKCGRDGRAPVL